MGVEGVETGRPDPWEVSQAHGVGSHPQGQDSGKEAGPSSRLGSYFPRRRRSLWVLRRGKWQEGTRGQLRADPGPLPETRVAPGLVPGRGVEAWRGHAGPRRSWEEGDKPEGHPRGKGMCLCSVRGH